MQDVLLAQSKIQFLYFPSRNIPIAADNVNLNFTHRNNYCLTLSARAFIYCAMQLYKANL